MSLLHQRCSTVSLGIGRAGSLKPGPGRPIGPEARARPDELVGPGTGPGHQKLGPARPSPPRKREMSGGGGERERRRESARAERETGKGEQDRERRTEPERERDRDRQCLLARPLRFCGFCEKYHHRQKPSFEVTSSSISISPFSPSVSQLIEAGFHELRGNTKLPSPALVKLSSKSISFPFAVMVDFILSKVIDGFTTLAQDEIKLVLGARGLVESLSTTLTLIRPALDDAEQQQVIEKGVRNWLRMLKGLAYDAEDIIDECIAKGLISRDHDDTKGKLCGFFPNPSYCFRNPTSFQDVKFRRDISIRVESLMEKMEEIKKAKDLFDFREGSFKGDVKSLPTSSLVNELEVVVKQEQLQTIIDAVSHAASLRTFLVFWGASPKLHNPYGFNLRIGDAARNLIENCKLLRVLDLGGTDIISLPGSVGELKLLRYLDVSLTHIRELPESTSKLCNLQTLKVIFCKKLLKLPNALGNMIQLRHLLFDYCDSITYLPTGINQLTCLQTLHCFIVGKGTGCNNINELNALNNLSERLKITNLENVACKEDAEAANLAAKSDLVTLKLVWSRHQSYPSTVATNAEGILEALQPPVSIERLDMTNYIGPSFPSWLGSSVLSKLVEIVIDGAAQCIHLPTLGNLPHLKNLSVTGTNSVRFVRHEFYGDGTTKGFPSLEKLEFCAMEEWEEWIGMDGIFKRLRTLYIRECPKLRSISNVLDHLSALQALWITSCHGLTTLAEELEQLNSLTSLRFVDCPKLSVLPKGLQHLPALQYLEIGQCPALTTLPWELQYLTALRALVIASCPKLTRLDNLMKFDKNAKCVSRLESLIISHCDGLVELPEEIRELVALKYLGIGYCIRLTALPTGIQRLNHLRTLQINGCPFIKKTLLEQKKEEWNHNLKIEVDYQTINQSSDGFAQKGGVISLDSEGQTNHRYKQITSVYCSRGYLE
ncbi:putative disease resistance protein [Nymphaea thermarum]|nr:putative disease resistance protein [Nymphaea thermarum]